MARVRHRKGSEEGSQRQAALVTFRHCRRGGSRRLRHVDEYAVRLLAVRYDEARETRLRVAGAGLRSREDRLPEAGWRAYLRPPFVRVPVEYEPRGEPAGTPPGEEHGPAEAFGARCLCRSIRALLPGRRLRVGG